MQLKSIKAAARERIGKGGSRRTRQSGDIPSVLYGGGSEAVNLRINTREFVRLVQTGGSHAIVQIEVDGDPGAGGPALLKAVQYHPVKGNPIHADFQRIRLDERIETLVPLHFVGHCKGVVDGGVLDFQLREVEVECLALEVPEFIEVDITDLGIGNSLHVSDIKAPANVTIVSEADRSVVAVHAPRLVTAEAPAAGEAVEGAEAAAPAEGAESKAPADPEKKESKGGKG